MYIGYETKITKSFAMMMQVLQGVDIVIPFCLQCYTVLGLELSRVTVVNSRLQVVYDTFIRPDNEVIDYNTR